MASKRARRRRSCGGKQAYDTKEAANGRISFVWRTSGEKLHTYSCDYCGKFHIGHRTARQRQSRRDQLRVARRTA